MDKPNQTDFVFQALASRPRRLMMDVVKRTPGCSVNDLCEHFDMSRIGVMKHLKVLVEAKLVISRKKGRTRELFFNAAPIQMIYDRWTDEYSAFWVTQAVDLKYRVEKETKKTRRNRKKSKKGTSASSKTLKSKKPKSNKKVS